ncbi:carbohydrate sulfotransferase 11-like [Anneissia japonica]|uniref:carbohydrate sulfotransferase 11-like n=1 Tax=Anneissia japonica TaxID=1529436 RepID=UPI001425911E|nr:carbohydrate sulfotransferase 11-like [Anneissia japonica]
MPRVRLKRLILVVATILFIYAIGVITSVFYVHDDRETEEKPLLQFKRDQPLPKKQENKVDHKFLENRAEAEHIDKHDERETNLHNANEVKDEGHWMESMDKKMRYRKKRLTNVCANYYNRHLIRINKLAESPRRLRALVVNDQRRFLYSIAYKVGSTNWERVIVELAGYKNVPNQKLYSHKALKWMPKFTTKEIVERLDNYTKFLFVRNPFSRILSAYKDKFVDHHFESFNKIGRTIIKNYRKSKFNETEIDGTDVSFQEFVDYLLDGHHKSNVHWTPIHSQNYPCEIDFNYIGKLEDSNDDIKYVLKKLGIWGHAYYRQGNIDPAHEKQRLATYYSSLDQQSFDELYRLYEPDFLIFGYRVSDIIRSNKN